VAIPVRAATSPTENLLTSTIVEVLPSEHMNETPFDEQAAVAIGNLDDFPIGEMRLRTVSGRRLLIIRTTAGVSALDHACPHEGYGLTQGYLSSDHTTLTCAWHNWKFEVATGVCVQGEESVLSHPVSVLPNGDVLVQLATVDLDAQKTFRRASLLKGIEHNYVGQIARDTVRLLQLHDDPGELVWLATSFGAARGDYGWGHSIAVAADSLSILAQEAAAARLSIEPRYVGTEAAVPLVTALAGISEESFGQPVHELPRPIAPGVDGRNKFFAAVEAEDLPTAQALLRGALHEGMGAADLQPWLLGVVSAHHLSYGHGAIYTQKAFQLLEHIGWHRADSVLPQLVRGLIMGTREDLLPYMRVFNRALSQEQIPLSDTVLAPQQPQPSIDQTLIHSLLDTADPTAALRRATQLLQSGELSIATLLDAVVHASSIRLLRYDVAGEDDLSDDFNWLDITHAMTYANAARWLHDRNPSPESVRLALFTVFLCHWTGRHEWHTRIGPVAEVAVPSGSAAEIGRALQYDALHDPGSQFIVSAHVIKTSVTATEEAIRLSSMLPLQAATRFAREPHRQRFTASAIRQSIDFVTRGRRE
jgi:nitrite reductase/ring-hydroxylating ferredoxin subunit